MTKVLIASRPTRNSWLESLYQNDIVRADLYTCQLADKLFFGQELSRHLGTKAEQYYPRTLGFRELFEPHWLREKGFDVAKALRAKVAAHFPFGAIVKPVAEINSGGETPGFYFDLEELYRDVEDLLKALSVHQAPPPHLSLIYSAITEQNWVSPALKTSVTGERLIFQSDLGVELFGQKSEGSKQFDEIRTHTFEGVAITGGDFHRWKVRPVKNRREFDWAQSFTQKFLNDLPAEMLGGQAWSLDLMIAGEDRIRILDVNTNRGRRGHWSGYLARPELIGAYTRHFERVLGLRYKGLNGFLLRNVFASYHKYFKKKYIEGIS